MWEQTETDPEHLEKSMRTTKKETAGTISSIPDSSPRTALISMLVYQAFLTLGRKMPTLSEDIRLFNDGWISALSKIPTDALKKSFSEAMETGNTFTPGLVVQTWQDSLNSTRDEIKRRNREDEENPFHFHAKLREAGTDRTYSFALREPALCKDCGRQAEVFRYFGPRKPNLLLCAFHGEYPR